MTWYCASILIALRKRSRDDEGFLVYENFVLIEANSSSEALDCANDIGKTEASIDDGLTIDDEPGQRIFCGVRKLIAVSNPHPLDQSKDQPTSRSEVSYSLYRVQGQDELRALAEGEAVDITYLE